MDLPLLLGAAFSFDPWTAGLIALAGATDIRELRREISVFRACWNRAQTSLSVMAASTTFAALGDLGDWPSTGGAALAALTADATVNYVIVAYGTSLRRQQPLSMTLTQMRIGSVRNFAVTYGCLGFVGILIAEVHQAIGFAGVLVSVAPVVLGSKALAHRFLLDRAEDRLAAKVGALRNVDERIAEERRDERNRIAAALHDDVLQDLYNVSIRAQVLRQDLQSGRLLDLEADLPGVLQATEVAVEDLREVIQGLRSASVGHAGLVETLTLFINHIAADSSVKIVPSLSDAVRSTPERELVIYQIAREAMTNSLRHSDARTIWVALRAADGERPAQLVIEDDGKGFDPDHRVDRHFGLELMRERADSIDASLAVSSSPGAGTVVKLTLDPKSGKP
jgi:signal transduction histidine kinase